MPELTFLSALLAGLFGSVHCLAMCGGIAAALGSADPARPGWQPLLYQCGRILSYGSAGAIAGALGAAAGLGFAASSWGATLRLGSAIMVVVIGLDISLGTSAVSRWLRAPERWGAVLWRHVAPARRVRLPGAPWLRPLLLGVLWGWLPCGLVYTVLVAAALSGTAAAGALTMLGFGLGTVPAMSTLSYAGWLPRREGLVPRLLGALLVACGLWTAADPLAVLTGSPAHQHHVIAAAPVSGAHLMEPMQATPAGRAGTAPQTGH
ncbi:MAG TPA: sulfite exporter TauE/SafE family protein [Steroidobacteraceae bacterium]|nr:sulfite exporter TauE/SafE family protein [Steroidobacteraceae bacterium]